MRKLDNQEIAHVSGGANIIVTFVGNILKAEGKILTTIFNLLTFNSFVKK